MCLTVTKNPLDCKNRTSTSPNSRERPLTMNTVWGTTERERERTKEGGCSVL